MSLEDIASKLPKVQKEAPVETVEQVKVEPEIKAEVKVETPKTEPVVTQETDQNDFKQHFEWLNADDSPEKEAKPSNQEPAQKTQEKDYSEVENKAKSYDELINDPIFKAMAQLKQEGKSLEEIANELQRGDYHKKSDKELYTEVLKSQNLTEDEIESELSKFDEMSLYQKKKLGEEIRAEKDKEYNSRLSKYSYSEPDNSWVEQAQTKAVSELSETLGKMSDQYYYGLKITPEVRSQIESYVMKNARVAPDGKSYDIKASIREAVAMDDKLFKKLLKANIDMALANGYDKAITERSRPSKEEGTLSQVGKPTVVDAIRQMRESRKDI